MAAGLQLSVTGILGFRTVHQVIEVHIVELCQRCFLLSFADLLGYRYNLRHKVYLLPTQAHPTISVIAP